VDQRRRFRALAHPQGADALWPVDLVRGDGDEVRPLRDSHPPETLNRIAQHQRPGLVGHCSDLRDRLGDADLVVDLHHGDQQHAVVELARK
jgi:hypothetical protein